jgi:glycosyltransferase 2 family protein
VNRSVPQLVSVTAAGVGILLFVVTLFYIDLQQTLASAAELGLALPVILLPGTCWHLLRTWGWSISFPDHARPAFSRLFRVRLAADAIGFFTVRGLASEPLRVLLLMDRSAPQVTTASVALERLAFAVIAIILAGLISFFSVTRLTMPNAWDTMFIMLAVLAVILLPLLALVTRRRSGDYVGRLVRLLNRVTGRDREASRVVRFVLDVEDVLLDLLRGDRKRLLILTALPVVCYALMAIEVWLVFWAIGQPLGLMEGLTVETFARLASVAAAAIPGSMGALEASNAAVVTMLGLTGGGSLALARRIRSLLWAGLGLVMYPRIKLPTSSSHPPGPNVPIKMER